MDVTGDGSKVQWYKEQYCIGTWNIRSMNQGKLEVVKQEMTRVNIDILGISELKCTGTGEFNADDHYSYYCGQKSLTKNGVILIIHKRVWNPVLEYNLKNDRIISISFQGKPSNITVIKVCAPTTNVKEVEVEKLYEDLQSSRANTKKRCPFHHGGLECKSRKSRDTWSNRQLWPWSTKWNRGKVNRVLPREHTGHSKHPLPITQEMTLHMDITRWSIPKSDWLYSLQLKMEKPYTVSENKTRSWLWLRSWTAYCQIQT